MTLIDTSKFAAYALKMPTEPFNNFRISFPKLFINFQRLQNELQLIYGDEQYKNIDPKS